MPRSVGEWAARVGRRLATPLLPMVLPLLLAGSPAGAAELTGRITDRDTGEPLAFTSVIIQATTFRTGVIADETGRYEAKDLPAGMYTVTFHYIGFESAEKFVALTDNARVILGAELRSSSIELETVEVRARRLEAPTRGVGRVALTQRQIQALPAFGETDPIRTLQFLPGVQTASDISSGLYVRGGGPDQTLILLDGVPVYNPTHAFGIFSTFNADVVGDVTLLKGAYPAQYGGRLGSVLDVRSRDGGREAVHGSVGASMVAARLALDGPVAGGSWAIGARRTYLDPILDALRNSTPEIPEYYFYDLNAKVAVPTPGRVGTVSMTGFLAQDDLYVSFDEGFVGQRWGNRAGSLAYQTPLSASLLGSLTLSGSRYKSGTNLEFFSTPISVENRLLDLSARFDVTRETESHRVTTGLATTRYQFDYKESFNRTTLEDMTKTPHDVSAFLQDEWEVTDRLSANDGVRVRYFSEGDRVLVEPRVSLSYAVTPRTRVELAGGVDHQYVQLVATEGFSGADLYVPLDDTVDPGVSYQAVVGVAWDPSDRWGFRAETYGTLLRNLITINNRSSDGETNQTIVDAFHVEGEGYATGVELFAEKRTGSVRGWIGYTLGWTRRRFDEVNQGRWYAPKYDRRHDLSAIATWEKGPWITSSAFVMGTGQAFTPASARYGIRNPATGMPVDEGLILASEKNSGRLLPYHRLDVSVGRRFLAFGRPAQWTFQVFNLYSRRNEWFVQYDTSDPTVAPEVAKMLPIIPTAGVSFDF